MNVSTGSRWTPAGAGEKKLVPGAGFSQSMSSSSTHNEAHWGVMGGTGIWPLVIPAVGNSGLPEGVGQALVPHAPEAANRQLP